MDNITHFFGMLTMGLLFYNLIKLYLNPKTKYYPLFLFAIISLITMGYGTIVELNELVTVLFFEEGGKGVGDYMNNVVDLFYNFLGAIVGAFIVLSYRNKKFIFVKN